MVRAYVLVKTGSGASKGVLEVARGAVGVVEAHVVAGEHDLIVEVDADDVYEVFDTVAATIGGADGVLNTKTYVALD